MVLYNHAIQQTNQSKCLGNVADQTTFHPKPYHCNFDSKVTMTLTKGQLEGQ